jgi:hypothetical protein
LLGTFLVGVSEIDMQKLQRRIIAPQAAEQMIIHLIISDVNLSFTSIIWPSPTHSYAQDDGSNNVRENR